MSKLCIAIASVIALLMAGVPPTLAENTTLATPVCRDVTCVSAIWCSAKVKLEMVNTVVTTEGMHSTAS